MPWDQNQPGKNLDGFGEKKVGGHKFWSFICIFIGFIAFLADK